MQLHFVIPCYNAAPNIEELYVSLLEQVDLDWSAHFIDDMSTDNTVHIINKIVESDKRCTITINDEKKFALRNIVEKSRSLPSDSIVAIIDGDDQLCNPQTVSLIKKAHENAKSVVWTAHRWDINNINISNYLAENVNPYQHVWVSSHLRTFDVSLLHDVHDDNFKDHSGKWFVRGYDQALMLPLLYLSKKRIYLKDVCYLYKIKSCSVNDRDWAEIKQLQTVNFVRARGFLQK